MCISGPRSSTVFDARQGRRVAKLGHASAPSVRESGVGCVASSHACEPLQYLKLGQQLPVTASIASLSEGDATALVTAATAAAAGEPSPNEPDDVGSDGDLPADGAPMTEHQRARELAKISHRIGELLGDFEDRADETSGESDLVRVKEGITSMAGTLRKKALMRVAFLQSAHLNMSKSRAADEDEQSDADSDDAGRGTIDASPRAMIQDVQRSEKTKKARLALVHSQAVGMLQEASRTLALRTEDDRKLRQARVAQLEVDLSMAQEEAKTRSAELANARAAANKADTQLAAVSQKLARQSSDLETAQREYEQLFQRAENLEKQLAAERRTRKEAAPREAKDGEAEAAAQLQQAHAQIAELQVRQRPVVYASDGTLGEAPRTRKALHTLPPRAAPDCHSAPTSWLARVRLCRGSRLRCRPRWRRRRRQRSEPARVATRLRDRPRLGVRTPRRRGCSSTRLSHRSRWPKRRLRRRDVRQRGLLGRQKAHSPQ